MLPFRRANDRNIGWKSKTAVSLTHGLEVGIRLKFARAFEDSAQLPVPHRVFFLARSDPLLYDQNK